MNSSNNAFWTRGRALAVAGLVCALGFCLPTTGHSMAPSSGAISQAALRAQQGTHPEQTQAGGPRDPDRIRDRPERRGRAQLMLSPAASVVATGDELSVHLFVLGAQELLRLPATLHYDPEVVRVVSVRAGSAWKNGTAPTLIYDTSRPGELVLGLARLGREATPITGAGELLQVTFEAVAPGDTELVLKRFALLGRRASSQRVEASPAKVSVQ